MFFHAATTTFETPCSWVFTKEDGSSGSCFAKALIYKRTPKIKSIVDYN